MSTTSSGSADAAHILLEGSDRPLKSVAYDCGFGTADRMRVVFSEGPGVTPAHYRCKLSKIRTTRQWLI
jgi:transcriptional regulator GlxA family with amidase domain